MLPALLAVVAALAPTADRVRVEPYEVDGRPVVVVRPSGAPPEGGWPWVITVSGLGEVKRGHRAAAAGYVERYGLVPALEALLAGEPTEAAFQGLVHGPLLETYTARRRCGFGGLVLVGVAAPVDYDRAFERHVLDHVIPWAERTLPVRAGSRGVEGISLGGRHALRLALARPGTFRSVGTAQAAVRRSGALLTALRRLPAEHAFALNLLTSRRDPFLDAVETLARGLRGAALPVRFAVTPGGHDKRFAKGPGVLDPLLFHDGVLRGAAPGTPRCPHVPAPE